MERSSATISSVSPELEISVFGTFTVRKQGEEVPMGNAVKLTVAILALEGEKGLATTRLLDLLWPAGSEATLRPRLNQRVLDFRQKVGVNESILCENGRHRLSAELVSTDVATVERLLAEKRLGEAAKIIANRLLRDVDLSASPGAEAWVRQRQLEFETRLKDAAEYVWQAAVRAGDWHVAADASGALFRLNPSDEGNLRKLIQVITRTERDLGRRWHEEEGIRLDFEALARRLEGKVSISKLDQLATEARRQQLILFSESSRGFRELPFVGRNAETRLLRDVLDGLSPGAIELVVVEGERGVGKTRFCVETLSRMTVEGRKVLTVRTEPNDARIARSLLARIMRTPWIMDQAEHLPDSSRRILQRVGRGGVAQRGEELDLEENHHLGSPTEYLVPLELCDAFSALLQRLSADEAVVCFFGCGDHTDPLSSAVLQSVFSTWEGGSLSVLVTRSEGGHPSLLASRGGFPDLIEPSAIVHLNPLPREQMDALLSSSGLDRLSTRVRARILRLSEGKPLYALELLSELSRPNHQQGHRGSPLLSHTLTSHLLQMGPEGTQFDTMLLIALACSPGDASPYALAECLSTHKSKVEARLMFLVAGGLVKASSEGFSIRGALRKEVILGHTDRGQVAYIAGQVLTSLSTRAKSDSKPVMTEELLRQARCKLLAGRFEDARSQVIELAELVGSLEEASALFSLVEDLLEAMNWEDTALNELATELALEFDWAHDALVHSRRWLEKATQLGQERSAAASRLKHLRAAFFAGTGSLSQLAEDLSRLRSFEMDGSWTDLLQEALDLEIRIADAALDHTRVQELLAHTHTLLDVRDLPALTRIKLSWVAGLGAFFGDMKGSLEHLTTASKLSGELGRSDLKLASLNRLLTVHISAGTLASREGRAVIREVQGSWDAKFSSLHLFYARMNVAVWYLDTWRPSEAIPKLIKSGEGIKHPIPSRARCYQHINLAAAYLRDRQPDQAETHLTLAKSLGTSGISSSAQETMLGLEGLIFLHNGDLPAARDAMSRLTRFPIEFSADPTYSLELTTRWHWHHRQYREIDNLLASAVSSVESRLPVHSIYLDDLFARYLLKMARPEEAFERWSHALVRARMLGLDWIANEIATAMESSRS